MSDADRAQDDEPLTQLDVDVDTSQLGSNVDTLPGGPATSRVPVPASSPADAEPQTMEPPRKMGVKRLRSPTLVGVAPPSAVNKGSSSLAQKVDEIPKITIEGNPDDETTTLVGKMLAESAAQARRNLDTKQAKDGDIYQDETATSVGDAERLIATANEIFEKARGDDLADEPTANRRRVDPLGDDTTARRDAIDVEGALARAAELKAKFEADAERKKKAEKKRTIVGLGNGPLKLPVIPVPDETETLSGGAPVPAPGFDEQETGSIPATPRERQMTAPLAAPLATPQTNPMPMPMPMAPPPPPPPGYPSTNALPVGTPPGGVPALPPYPPMPTPRRSDPIAFAQTQQALPQSHGVHGAEAPKKKSRVGVVLFLLVLLGAGGGAAYWKRVPLRARWDRFRHPPVAQPAPSVDPAPAPSASPPASASASASVAASASAAPSASASAAASASAFASASASASAKPGAKKPPPWKPKPAPKPKAAVPKPVDQHGF